MDKEKLLEVFKDKLPASLGVPYFVITKEKPYVFVAFYGAMQHELSDDRIIHGNEFRLWKASTGLKKSNPLAGIIGIDENAASIVLFALINEGTRSRDLKPYRQMILEMMADIETGNIGEWN